MMLDLAYVEDLLVHDVAAIGSSPYALRSVDLGSTPAPRQESSARPRAHGSTNRTRVYNARTVNLVGYCDAGDPESTRAALDELKRRLMLKGTPFRFTFRPLGASESYRITLVPSGEFQAPASGWEPFVRWAISCEAPDPRYYTDTPNGGAYFPFGTSSGLRFPLLLPLRFEGDDSTYLTVENGGTIETPPTFTISGPGTFAAIDNLTTSQSIYFDALTLTAGQTASVDVAARRFLFESAASPEYIDGRHTKWFELAPGPNQMRLRGSDFVVGTTALAVSFRDARA